MQIAYWLPYAGSGNATLNLTLSGGGTTGAVNCYYNGTSRLTTHYGAGNLVHLTYRSNVNIGGTSYTGWWSNANYDSNDGYCNRFIYSNSYKSGTVGLFPYALVMERSDGTLDSIVTSSSTGTSKACNANGFKLPRVLYYNSTTAASTALATYALYEAYTNLIDARYSFNITTSSLTARLPVYLVGAMGTNGLFFLDTTQWWSQALPSSNDGKVYIHVGEAYDGYRIILNYDKPIYKYINGMVQQWVPSTGYAASAGTAASATNATNDDSGRQISTYYAHTLTTSGNTIGLEDGNGDDISGSFITVPYATSAGSATTAGTANSVAWANVSGHAAGVKADIGIATSGSTFLRKDGTWATPTDTNTTYAISGDLSSHKFTTTLTATNPSGTSTAALELAAGNNISLTDDTTNKKITIAAANTTYTLGTGTTTVTLTPSSGDQQSITVPYATSAGKATNDASGRAIETTYGHALTTSGNTIGLEDGNGDAISGSFITAPYATVSGKISNITSTDTASSSATWRKVWMSYADGVTGRPAVTDALVF